jgi:hypothetical protein
MNHFQVGRDTTQYELVAEAAEALKPVHQELVKQAAQGKLAHLDDTSMKILKLERERTDSRTGIFTTGVVSVQDAFQIALFFTGRNHAGENMANLLKNREPNLPGLIQMSDALSSNFSELESDEDVIACCMAHGRRNFVKIADHFPEECRHVLTAIGRMYQNDRHCKENNFTPAQRLAHHQAESQPVAEGLHRWLDDQIRFQKVEPNSSCGKAIRYLLNHWKELTLFLRVEGAPLDNNVCERALKSVVLHRKNSLFYKTDKGAKTGDLFMSLIQTCQLNKVNPFDYLTLLQRRADLVARAPEKWLPWNYLEAEGAANTS